MRLLQLATGPGELLDLHPQVTVVRALEPATRQLLVDAVAGLAERRTVGQGLLEAHGVLFELDEALLALLDLRSDGVDPIVRSADLPAQPLTVDARELRRREQEFSALLARISDQVEQNAKGRDAVESAAAAVASARRARADAESGADDRVRQIDELTIAVDRLSEQERSRHDELATAESALAAADAALAEARTEVDSVTSAAQAAATSVEQRRAELAELVAADDPEAEVALQQAQADLELAQAPLPTPDPDDEPSAAEPVERLAQVEHRLQLLGHLIASLAVPGQPLVAEALERVRRIGEGEHVPSAEAHALADELDELDAALAGGDELDELPPDTVAAARQRLDDANAALLEAEEAVRNRTLDPEEVAHLEQAHEEVLDAIERADGRFAGARAQARVEAARDVEQEVLDRLGFTSYSEYMMGLSLLHPDPEKEAALAAARAELAAAEDAWHAIEGQTEVALERATALDRRRRLHEEARELLGEVPEDGDWTGALRSLLVPAISRAELARDLQQRLVEVGLDVGDEPEDEEELVELAAAWLEELAQQGDRRSGYEREEEELLLERDQLVALVGPIEPPAPDRPDAATLRAERIAAAEAAVVGAEERRSAARDAARRRPEAEAQLATAEADASTSVERLAAAQAVADAAARELEAMRTRAESARQAVLAATAEADDARSALRALAEGPDDMDALDAEVEDAIRRHTEALAALEAGTQALATLDAEGQAAALEIERLQDIVTAQDSGEVTEAAELEWYLLARVASQRSVSVAGSLPLLLDDALRELDGADVEHLLGRLERMADTVQVIILSEDPLVSGWAEAAGPARAAVVTPGPV